MSYHYGLKDFIGYIRLFFFDERSKLKLTASHGRRLLIIIFFIIGLIKGFDYVIELPLFIIPIRRQQ